MQLILKPKEVTCLVFRSSTFGTPASHADHRVRCIGSGGGDERHQGQPRQPRNEHGTCLPGGKGQGALPRFSGPPGASCPAGETRKRGDRPTDPPTCSQRGARRSKGERSLHSHQRTCCSAAHLTTQEPRAFYRETVDPLYIRGHPLPEVFGHLPSSWGAPIAPARGAAHVFGGHHAPR